MITRISSVIRRYMARDGGRRAVLHPGHPGAGLHSALAGYRGAESTRPPGQGDLLPTAAAARCGVSMSRSPRPRRPSPDSSRSSGTGSSPSPPARIQSTRARGQGQGPSRAQGLHHQPRRLPGWHPGHGRVRNRLLPPAVAHPKILLDVHARPEGPSRLPPQARVHRRPHLSIVFAARAVTRFIEAPHRLVHQAVRPYRTPLPHQPVPAPASTS
jgi:hypothetical protein